jgi:hypothetical protein
LGNKPQIIMKKILASALVLTLFSSYVKPEEVKENESRLFRDTEFTFSCNDNDCKTMTATAPNITLSGDAESMQFLKTAEGKEMMDKMLQQLIVECIKGNVHSVDEADMDKIKAEDDAARIKNSK